MMTAQCQDKQLSQLGFGTMRPTFSGTERNAPIDEAAVNNMVRYAYEICRIREEAARKTV